MSDRDVRKEVEAKNEEWLRQADLGPVDDDGLDGYDKTDADSFPASDPPEAAPEETPEDADRAASAAISGVGPNDE